MQSPFEHFEINTVVIGAGVVGLSCAAAIARTGKEVLLLEATTNIGTGISSRNSEVIHAGIYYPPGSLKARLCVEGRQRLYQYCKNRSIAYQRCGKLIVATTDTQANTLQTLQSRATANDVCLKLIDGANAKKIEPALSASVSMALISPETGIIDSHGLMIALQGEFENSGGVIAFNAPVIGGTTNPNYIEIATGGDTPTIIRAQHCINAGGLNAIKIAKLFQNNTNTNLPKPFFAKGSYFSYAARNPFTRLIYPTPVEGGLGVHLTFDLSGAARFGPDVEWLPTNQLEELDFTVNPNRLAEFGEAISSYWSDIDPTLLQPDYAGIRPKTSGPGSPAGDFIINNLNFEHNHGLIHLLGIESPGLTSSLAIADEIINRLLTIE